MAQKTDLNISPYYDDFDGDKNFYKVLFKPGFPVQARELTTLQSILQNQVESFGGNIFKEGSMVLPGSVTFDNQFSAVKLNAVNLGIDVSVYIKNFIGKKITGQLSGVTASIQEVALTSDSDLVTDITIYVKYGESGDDADIDTFQDGEQLFASENVTYGNTTINAGTVFASLISQDATSIGSAASIDNGVYFIRGTFVEVSKQTLILDYYTNTPSYRVGLKVSETIVNAKDDSSLYDNASGFTNFAAPGADRLKIALTLTKKEISNNTDTDFVEILRVDEGRIKKIENKPVYNLLRDYIAERTFDESGHYAIDEFDVKALNSLNDQIDNDGLYLEGETTEQGNTPSDDLMCLQVSPGRAYVDGYDVTLDTETAVDVEKPRDTESVSSVSIPFEMGHLLRVNNVSGAPKENETLDLYGQLGAGGSIIGAARVYTFNLTDAAYSAAATQWDLYLYDIQTYTNVTFNRSVTATEIPTSSFIKGKSSGASGFVVLGTSASSLNLSQTSGTFVTGEKLIVNGVETALTIKSFVQNNINQLKSVKQTGVSGFPNFNADAVLSPKKFSNGIAEVNIASGSVTSAGRLFSGVKVNDVISVMQGGILKYNRITAISSNLSTLTLGTITDVSGVFDGNPVITDGDYTANLRVPKIRNSENGFLYANLPESNISSVDLSNSQLAITNQITGESTDGNGKLVFDVAATGITSAFYESFDQERYSVHYTGGGIGAITSDAFTLTGGGTGVEIEGLTSGQSSNVVVNVTLKKNGIQSKVKKFTRSAIKVVNLSKLVQSGSTSSISINDGLTYNKFYGLRVQDDQISLNVPDVSKVLAVYESTNTGDPKLDAIEFSSISNVGEDAIIGENIIGSESGTVARVVTNENSTSSYFSSPKSNKLGVVYLNQNTFIAGETVTFEESNIISNVQSITLGEYNNIIDNFVLDGGQKNEYYDYSRLIRTTDSEPSKRLLVVFDHYIVPATDSGDVFTVLSYDSDRFLNDIPTIGPNNVRASDTLDFRPRIVNYSSTTASPFDFGSRTFTTKYNLKPGESSILGFDFYLPRIDKLYLDKFENLIISKGVSAKEPKASPSNDQSLMELATIILPPYLYDPDDVSINLVDNRRYTMRDIGQLEDRIENLERVTSLSLLEVSTEALRIEDEDGNNRFKSGFFVDNFTDGTNSDQNLTSADISEGQLRPRLLSNSLRQRVLPSSEISEEDLDLTTNFELLDPNIQKTGNVVTLKYDSIGWLEQPLATRVENVNPFHVVEYVGSVKLSPENDFWIRTIYIPPSVRNTTRRTTNVVTNTVRNTVTRPLESATRTFTFNRFIGRPSNGTVRRAGTFTINIRQQTDWRSSTNSRTQTTTSSRTRVDVRSRDVLISSGDEQYIRSRNVSFLGRSLKPLTRHYQFLDNHSNVDFIPKLLEIANSTSLDTYGTLQGSFTSGETVKVYKEGKETGRFRLAKSNHKEGPFKSPSRTYNINPYVRSENLPTSYSQSSKTLNIDLNALSDEAQGRFFGYVAKGAKIVGQTSGAIAYVKNLRLITDNYGDLFGSFFIKNPHTNPAPNPRLLTGKKTYLLTSSSTNTKPLPGSKLISTGQGSYSAVGTLLTRQIQTTVTTTIDTTVRPTTTITTTRREVVRARRCDPLAQSFVVGRDIDAPDLNGFSSDDKGVVLTELDLYFAKKPVGNEPLEVQIRTVELGIPTLNLVGEPKTLYPDQIATSTTGETATRVTFDEPKYLAPGNEYAVVLLAPTSDEYEVWIAKMGEKTVNTQSLPDAEAVVYTKQFALGSLFKSQNGSIWTPTQELDLKFKLYKAKFTANTGIAYFGNPPLDQSNGYVNNLLANPVTGLPKTINLGITTVTNSETISILSTGRKIAGSIPNSYGYIEYAGGPVSGTPTVTNGGENYTTQSDLATNTLVGKGSGLRLTIAQTAGVITGVTRTANGNGYEVGDVVTVTSATTGRGALITIGAITGRDTLYLTDVQGEKGATKAFRENIGVGVSYYDTDTTIVSLGSTIILIVNEDTGINSGNFLEVSHFNHGMYANNNKLQLNGVESNISPSILTSDLLSSNTSTIFVKDSSVFTTFEGLPISISNPGYVKIGDEVISYTTVSSNELGGVIVRGIEGKIESHEVNSKVKKYEFNGVSLRRINNVIYDISDTGIDSNGYYIEVDRSATYGVNRSADAATLPQLSFDRKFIGGGNKVYATENIQFNSVHPRFFIQAPGDSTSVNAVVRTTTGTSIDGSETSFQLLNKVEPVELNSFNNLKSTRIVCSRVNELQQPVFNNVSGRRSFTTAITLNSTDENLSPIINLEDSTIEFASNYLNRPITDFASDSRVNSILNDPHSAIYVSDTVGLSKPASSLKVILGAYRPASADIRVLYSLIRDDSSEIEQEFELFPGFENLETTSDGGFRVVDPSLNNGKSDVKVPPSSANQFLEYEFSADNLGEFSGYSIKIIMSGTDQANAPIISDLRTIALA